MNKATLKIFRKLLNKKSELDVEKFWKRYRHIGYAGLGVPRGWVLITAKALINIEREMWPGWMPFWMKHLIHYLATDNSVVRIKYRWAYNLKQKIVHCMVTDVKEKYAYLCIYGFFTKKMNEIVEKAVEACNKTCQNCGSQDQLFLTEGWIERLCVNCLNKVDGIRGKVVKV